MVPAESAQVDKRAGVHRFQDARQNTFILIVGVHHQQDGICSTAQSFKAVHGLGSRLDQIRHRFRTDIIQHHVKAVPDQIFSNTVAHHAKAGHSDLHSLPPNLMPAPARRACDILYDPRRAAGQ